MPPFLLLQYCSRIPCTAFCIIVTSMPPTLLTKAPLICMSRWSETTLFTREECFPQEDDLWIQLPNQDVNVQVESEALQSKQWAERKTSQSDQRVHACIKLGFSRLHSQARYERSRAIWSTELILTTQYLHCGYPLDWYLVDITYAGFLATCSRWIWHKTWLSLVCISWDGCLANTLDWEISIPKLLQTTMSQLAVKDVPSHYILFWKWSF